MRRSRRRTNVDNYNTKRIRFPRMSALSLSLTLSSSFMANVGSSTQPPHLSPLFFLFLGGIALFLPGGCLLSQNEMLYSCQRRSAERNEVCVCVWEYKMKSIFRYKHPPFSSTDSRGFRKKRKSKKEREKERERNRWRENGREKIVTMCYNIFA